MHAAPTTALLLLDERMLVYEIRRRTERWGLDDDDNRTNSSDSDSSDSDSSSDDANKANNFNNNLINNIFYDNTYANDNNNNSSKRARTGSQHTNYDSFDQFSFFTSNGLCCTCVARFS